MTGQRAVGERPPLVTGFGSLRWPIVAFGLMAAVFLLLPILAIFPVSFSESRFLVFPPEGFSLRSYEEVLTDPMWRDAFLTSVRIAAIGTAIATIAGTAAALAIRRLSARLGGWLRTLFIAPIALPIVVYALGLFNLFDALRVLGATWPIAIGQAVLAFPIAFVAVSASLARVDPRLVHAAEGLGARWPTIVWRVELPAVRLTIVAAAVFVFAFAFDETVVALFLAGPETRTLPVAIYTEVLASASPTIAAVSAIVTVIACVVVGAATAMLGHARRRAGA